MLLRARPLAVAGLLLVSGILLGGTCAVADTSSEDTPRPYVRWYLDRGLNLEVRRLRPGLLEPLAGPASDLLLHAQAGFRLSADGAVFEGNDQDADPGGLRRAYNSRPPLALGTRASTGRGFSMNGRANEEASASIDIGGSNWPTCRIGGTFWPWRRPVKFYLEIGVINGEFSLDQSYLTVPGLPYVGCRTDLRTAICACCRHAST